VLMSRLSRTLLSVGVGVASGLLGGLLVAIFGPLLFPESLQGPTPGEGVLMIAFVAFFLSFAVAGYRLCRRATRRLVREGADEAGRVLFR
jgi:hypothetical protein